MHDQDPSSDVSGLLPPLRRGALALCLLLAMAATVGYAHLWRSLAMAPVAVAPPVRLDFPAAPPLSAHDWSALRAAPGRRPRPAGGPAVRFRLAGTFVVLGDGPDAQGGVPLRKAILDDLEQGGQLLIGEGETIGPVRVSRVWADRVVLDAEGEISELRLSYLGGGADGDGIPTADAGGGDGDEPALETSRFGKRIAETRWVLSKPVLMDYYRELLDEPERIGRLFETFEPVYTPEERIQGYRVAIKGEEEFLQAAGLRNGDVVRSVNSLNMTSQSRAEFFIREFAQDRLDAVVIDIEREGAPRKLIYLMR
jgi:type II secretory pathway component PulC